MSWSCGWSGGCAVGHDPAAWQGKQMHGQMMDMMHGMGMTDPMMRHSAMMMHAPTSPSDPSSMLALKEDLDLSADQVSQLEGIAKQAQEQALGVLTDEQRSSLETLPPAASTMQGMWQNMDRKMQEWHGQHPNDPVMCPFHMMMMHEMHPQK